MKATLKKLGYDYPVTASARPGVAPQPADARQPVLVTAGTMKLPVEAAALIAVDHEVADRCIANYRAEMDKLSGLKLDKRFIGNQLDEHLALKDKVETFRQHASKDMTPALDDGLKIIETHIATCKSVMEKLDGMKDTGK